MLYHTLKHGLVKVSFAALLVVTFLGVASSQVALAEMRTLSSCNNNGRSVYINTALQYGEYQAQTNNNLAGCTHLYVRLRRWFGQIRTERYDADIPENNGNGIAGWVGLPASYTPGYVFVAQHAVQRRVEGQLPTPLQISWTSDNGTHSNGSWFCWNTGGGNPGGGCISP